MAKRPPLSPSPHSQDDPWDAVSSPSCTWTPVCSCTAGFSAEMFDAAVTQLVEHPEYNSTLILRSEVIEESTALPESRTLTLDGFHILKNIHRRLLPRRPGRDAAIDQDCTFYSEEDIDEHGPSSCLVLSPILSPGSPMPYYHPAVFHIAFRFLHSTDATEDNSRIRIEVVPQPDASDPKDVNSRLYRTCVSLLETVHRYGWGFATNYQKQVFHDCVVSREEYQDLYLVLRERHKHLVGQCQENTDPLKHVYEDIGIATFLMLLWKQGVFAGDSSSAIPFDGDRDDDIPAWHKWSRPPGGFLDFGCGNGLLVHILVSEGYAGVGIDLRARNSWMHYPPSTQAHLHVHALNPLEIDFDDPASLAENPYLRPGTFIIANHADELSPWTPTLATLSGASGFLSIPCCPWSFDARFHRSQLILKEGAERGPFAISPRGLPGQKADPEEFVASLRLGGMASDAGKSAYTVYRVWLAVLDVRCGWEAETETLRIPSTRNWSLVGRRRCGDEKAARAFSLNVINEVRYRGLFATRKPEGKAGEH